MKLGVLTSFNEEYRLYATACEELGVDYRVVDFLGPGWLGECAASDLDGFLVRPPSEYPEQKVLYDERLYILARVMARPIYPTLDELLIYENKRNLAYWLEHFGLPHVETRVFTRKADALAYARTATYPLVSKSSLGAAGRGVFFIKSEAEAKLLAHQVFGFPSVRIFPGRSFRKYYGPVPVPILGPVQRHYLILQQAVDFAHEWRLIRIGRSYFGRQKLKDRHGFASGSGQFGWVRPPDELLRLVKETCDRLGFRSMAFDVFETRDGRFLINELQSLFGFGFSGDVQMKVDGQPGRLVEDGETFRFEAGVFNRNGSYNLRVEDFLELLAARPAS